MAAPNKKTEIKNLKKKLFSDRHSHSPEMTKIHTKEYNTFAKNYIQFLNTAKTERLTVDIVKNEAEKKGYKNFASVKSKKELEQNKKFYFINKNKNIILFQLGKTELKKGFNLLASHIDAPRIDIKQSPLYEDSGLALFKTHYYGGIRKYHWVNLPLAIHGIVVKKDGKTVDIHIGEKDTDPIFVISDLLPHLARKVQGNKKLSEGITGEQLNLIVGSEPFDNDTEESRADKEAVKLKIMQILNQKYGIIEEDFYSAELELVPAMKARYAGFDESLIAGYGQDDRICAYTSMQAIFNIPASNRTSIVFMADKEEIGSNGITGMQSWFFVYFLGKLLNILYPNYNDALLRETLFNSYALSADVDANVNPSFKEVYDPLNSAHVNKGIIITKYTGGGGKYSASDANAEFVGKVRHVFNKNKVKYQIAELGKVDEGGGGTIAKYLAQIGIETLDCGPGLIGMHSTYEISSKFDVYQTFKAYSTFLEKLV